MDTHLAKRIEIIIERALLSRLENALEEAGVTGYTVLPVFGGHGRSGHWTREGQVSLGEGMAAVVSIVAPDRVEAVVEAVSPLVIRHIGIFSVSDCMVLRKERF